MYVQTAVKMHAHKCEACAKNGEEVIWIHPDTCRGQVHAHTCPKCGKVEWKQCRVESAKLPQVQTVQHGPSNLETMLGYIVLAVGLAMLAYSAYVFITEKRKAKGNVAA